MNEWKLGKGGKLYRDDYRSLDFTFIACRLVCL